MIFLITLVMGIKFITPFSLLLLYKCAPPIHRHTYSPPPILFFVSNFITSLALSLPLPRCPNLWLQITMAAIILFIAFLPEGLF